jgi:hypothetical protein
MRQSEVSQRAAATDRKEDTLYKAKAEIWFFMVSMPLLLLVARAA